MRQMSLTVTKIIKPVTKATPIRKPNSCALRPSGFPRTASMAQKSKCPPSSMGIGTRLIMPRETDRSAAKFKRAGMPLAAAKFEI